MKRHPRSTAFHIQAAQFSSFFSLQPKRYDTTMIMQRMKMMTLGFFLILFGIQLNLVDSVELSPRFATFLSEQHVSPTQLTDPNLTTNRFSQAAYGSVPAYNQPPVRPPQRISEISIPKWLCWPGMFMGAVLVLQGAIKPE
jgi:hypothetical protein